MNEHDNNEQPEASSSPESKSKPLSDFNDLHVAVGLGEVRAQIEHGIANQVPTIVDVDVASAVPPTPSDGASQTLGSQVEKTEDFPKNQDNSANNDEFFLTYAPPMNGHPDVGEPEKQGRGDKTDKLADALDRYAVIACSSNAFDYRNNHKFKISSLRHTLGNVIYKHWYSHEDRKTIENDEVEKLLVEKAGDVAPVMSKNCILLKGETFIYDKSLNRVVSWSAAQLMYPHEYKKWIESRVRSEIDYEKLIFDPTRKIDIDPNYINTFEGYSADEILDEDHKRVDSQQASIGCVAILEMIDSLCNGDADIEKWLMQWLAYPLINEGAKAHSSVLMASHVPGSGKTTLFEKVMGGIYGKYHRTITSQELESPQFNGWLNNAAFIFGEEIATNATKYNVTPYLNALVTAKNVTINEKQRPQKQVPAYFNMAFASNENIPFPLHGEARRWFVIAPESKLDESISERVYQEIADGGIDAFYTYLLNVALDDFKHDKPPLTQAKKALINASKRSVEVFIDEWLEGETKHPICCCQARQLYDAYKSWASSTLEHKYTYRRFTDDIRKIEGIRLLEKQHWKHRHKGGQSLMVVVGASPSNKNAIDWYGECVDQFEDSLSNAASGGVPNVLDNR